MLMFLNSVYLIQIKPSILSGTPSVHTILDNQDITKNLLKFIYYYCISLKNKADKFHFSFITSIIIYCMK